MSFNHPRVRTGRRFPLFGSHGAAAAWGCPQCGGGLDAASAGTTGRPANGGKYRLICAECECPLRYDLCDADGGLICECGAAIPLARIAAVPDATECTACASELDNKRRVVGMMVWDGKHSPTLEVNTELARELAAEPGTTGRRHGCRQRFGPRLRFEKRLGEDGAEAVMAEAMDLREVARKTRGEPELAFEPARVANPARCHAGRERIGPSGLCLECALAKQAVRVDRSHR